MKKVTNKHEVIDLLKQHKITAEEAYQLLQENSEQNVQVFSYETMWEPFEVDTGIDAQDDKRIVIITEDENAVKELCGKESNGNQMTIVDRIEDVDLEEEYDSYVYLRTSIHEKLNEKEDILQLFDLAKGLIQRKNKKNINLIYGYLNETKDTLPSYAAVAGFFRTLRNENPRILGRVVEFQEKAQMVQQLLSELKETQTKDSEVKYENGVRLVNHIKRMELPELTDDIYVNKGVYIITGGAGGLGRIVATYLAQRYNAYVFITGRSDLSDKKMSEVAKLCEKQPNIEYMKADISKLEDTKNLIEKIKIKHARIHGVFHAAGVYHNGFILKKSREEFETTLLPKVDGVVNLDECLGKENLDFFVIFSSLAGVTGKVGQSDYTYANAFQDNFANYRENLVKQGQRSGHTVSIDWPLWEQGGMTLSKEEQQELSSEGGVQALPTKEGLNCIEAAIVSSNTQIAITYAAKDVFAANESEEAVEKEEGQESEIDMKKLVSRTKRYVKQLICKGTGMQEEKIEDDVNLDEYGVDSIIVNTVNSELEKEIGNVTKTLLYEYQTVDGITEYLVESHRNELIRYFGESFEKENKSAPVAKKVIEKKVVESKKPTPQAKPLKRACDEIAIIGVSGRYPQADNLNEFWQNLCEGKDCVTEVPKDRWNIKEYFSDEFDKLPEGKMYCKWGGFLDKAFDFDPLLFNISPIEAEMMDPQERLFLEVSWEAMEDAGYTRKGIRELIEKKKTADVGVFVGVTSTTYQLHGPSQWLTKNYVMPNSSEWSVANRVSYVYNLQGPSITVDTACSSALSAVHLACESIRNGESSVCIVGGVNVYSHPYKYVLMSQMKMLSPTGRCHSFGDDGDGFVPGEGAGALILKSREDAERDGDHIYAIIKATAVNHDGKTNGYMVPSPTAQTKVILEALKKANVDPRTINYIEAHGTGTKLGDPIEITGLTKAYGNYTNDKGFCAIGSVKSNIGHLEAAAGVASITKVLLQMKYQKLVPTIHCEVTNSNIDFETTPFYLERGMEEWKHVENPSEHSEYPYRAGVSSFGAGGSNAHVIMEEYRPQRSNHTAKTGTEYCIPMSASSKEVLHQYVQKTIAYLDTVRAEKASTLPDVFAPIIETVKQEINGWDFIEESAVTRYLKVTKILEAFNSALLLSKFQQSGIFIKAGDAYTEKEIFESMHFIPLYERLLHAQLGILEENGYIKGNGNQFIATQQVEGSEYLLIKETFEERKEQILEEYPEISAYANLLWICIEAYPAVWTGRVGYQDVMFPGGSMELVKGIYRGNEVVDYFNVVLANGIKEYVRKRVEEDPNATIRVLEVGAGTGGSSVFVLKELAEFSKNVQYIYTDISAGFTQFGKREFGSQYPFIEFKVLDIEKELEEQGYRAGSIDVVLGCNVFHATKNITKTMSNVRKLLSQNGLVFINEVTDRTASATMTFGLTNGWWLYEDEGIRIEDSPLLSAKSWEELLKNVGFGETDHFGFAEDSNIDSWQHVIVGQAIGTQAAVSLDEFMNLQDTSYTFCTGREEMEERVAFVAKSVDQWYDAMKQYVTSEKQSSDVIYVGNAKSNNITSLLGSELSQELSDMVMNKLDVKNIAKLWVSGVRINWTSMFPEEGVYKVSLPSYPFDHRTYRIYTNEVTYQTIKQIEPWIDAVDYKESLDSGIAFLKTWKKDTMEDEICDSVTQFPELMLLEMVLEANKTLEFAQPYVLEKVCFGEEIIDTENEVSLCLRVKPDGENYEYDLEVVGQESSLNVLTAQSVEGQDQEIKTVSISSMLASYEKYDQSKVDAMEFNHSHAIREVWKDDKKQIARVMTTVAEGKGLMIHPSIWLAITDLLSSESKGNHELLRPSIVDKVAFYKEIPGECYLYVEQVAQSAYHVAIIDANGCVCVKLSNLQVTVMENTADRMTYSPIWKQQTMNPLLSEDNDNQSVIIVYGEEGIQLANKINQRYQNTATMLFVGERLHSVDEYKALLEKQTKPCVIYVLTGILNLDNNKEELQRLQKVQQEGIGEIYRLVQGLGKSSKNGTEVTMLCITNQVNQIAHDECVNFYAAGINGFVRNVVKEYTNFKAYTIDVDLEEVYQDETVFNQVILGYDVKNGEEVVVRNRRCYLRVMTHTKLPKTTETKFREQGVYFIIGGLGSIGYDFACYLAKNFHATILITGLSALDERRKTQLATIESFGGKAVYYQVDVSNYDAMSEVARQIKESFGQVHGIIHSAMNFKEEMIQDVSEDVLLRTLQPKMQGAIILHRLFKDTNYDFMIFYSSGQSYTGNVKRAHYAAACNFEDCYARMLSEKAGEPVKVVNWGFWGELKGQPITDEFRDFLIGGGVTPIVPADGIEVVERFLTSDLPQVCTYHVQDFVLKFMGAEFDYVVDADITTKDAKIALPRPEDQPIFEAGAESFFALKRLSHVMLLEVFQKMGVFFKQGESYNKDELFERLAIIPEYNRLYEALLLIMTDAGYITVRKDTITTNPLVEDSLVCEEIASIPETIATLVETMPEIFAYTRLLSTCMESYPEILTGVTKATDVMFPNSSMDLVEDIYKGNEGIDYFNILVANSVYDFIQKRSGHVNILEIGAGTGGTSAIVLEKIAGIASDVTYTYTDISKAFIQHGKREYGSKYDFMEFTTVDIEKDVIEQGLELRSYDLIICANVLHATKDMTRTIRHVKQLLKKNGWLILNEAVQVQEFTTLTFGLTSGWWLYDDVHNRMPGSPLLSRALWKSILSEEGFNEIVALGETGKEQSAIQNVIIAESDGCIRLESTVSEKPKQTSVKKEKKAKEQKAKEKQTMVAKPQEIKTPKKPKETKVVVKKKVDPEVKVRESIERAVADLLQMDASMIEYDKAFMDFGVDSIMATKITSILNEELEIELQASDLFDYPTINDMTEYIISSFTIQVSESEEVVAVNDAESEGLFEDFSVEPEEEYSEELGDSEVSEEDNDFEDEILDEDAKMLKILQMLENKEIDMNEAQAYLGDIADE